MLLSRVVLVCDSLALGFAIGAAGSACWILYAYLTRTWSLLVLDGILLLVDLCGVARH